MCATHVVSGVVEPEELARDGKGSYRQPTRWRRDAVPSAGKRPLLGNVVHGRRAGTCGRAVDIVREVFERTGRGRPKKLRDSLLLRNRRERRSF